MQIKLYLDSSDPYCSMIENLLKYHNLEYERVEVSRDSEKMKELQKISGQTNVPVVVIDEKVFVGFDPGQLKKILNLPENKNQSSS